MQAVTPEDHAQVVRLLMDAWGGGTVVAGHGTRYDAATLPGLLARSADGRPAGLVTWQIADDGMEIVTINAAVPHLGVGSALLAAAIDVARAAGIARVWLVTTNDNLDALRFYQRRGLRIAAVVPGAVAVARALKPTIPLVGAYGIEMNDELVLELLL